MTYIKHDSSNFSVIDCNLLEDKRDIILEEIEEESRNKTITRFISTHPDEDHIHGIEYLFNGKIQNFHLVDNKVNKLEDTESFNKYKELRDKNLTNKFSISKDCERRYISAGDGIIESSGIKMLWPDLKNYFFQKELKMSNDDPSHSPNNLSPILTYSNGSFKAMFMGDLTTEYMEVIEPYVNWEKINVLLAPHHGRKSGHIPAKIMKQINPDIIIIGIEPSKDADYYNNYNTLRQSECGDIMIDFSNEKLDIFVKNFKYNKKHSELFQSNNHSPETQMKYIGSFKK